MRKFSTAALVATWALCTAPSAALQQNQDLCGSDVQPVDAAGLMAMDLSGLYQFFGPATGIYKLPRCVRLRFHIVRTDAGEGGLSVPTIIQMVADANAAFAGSSIRFVFEGLHYVDSDAFYYHINTLDEINALRQTNPAPASINVYCTENLAWGAFGLCGISSFTSSPVQGIVMNNECTPRGGNHSTFPHELGHYFNLYHTHETFLGIGCASESNCSTTGDMVCDTPADPNLSGKVNANCDYVGGGVGPCPGDPAYAPDTNNLMSYAPKSCRTRFTAGQKCRAYSTLAFLRPELLQTCGQTGPYLPLSSGGFGAAPFLP